MTILLWVVTTIETFGRITTARSEKNCEEKLTETHTYDVRVDVVSEYGMAESNRESS